MVKIKLKIISSIRKTQVSSFCLFLEKQIFWNTDFKNTNFFYLRESFHSKLWSDWHVKFHHTEIFSRSIQVLVRLHIWNSPLRALSFPPTRRPIDYFFFQIHAVSCLAPRRHGKIFRLARAAVSSMDYFLIWNRWTAPAAATTSTAASHNSSAVVSKVYTPYRLTDIYLLETTISRSSRHKRDVPRTK